MKKLLIDGTTRKISKDKIVVGYLQENKIEKLEFEIPEEYKTYGRKACFKAQDKTFAKIFDDITSDTLTLTRDMTQYDELEMSIAFFKTENEDEIVARTSILKIYIENAIICDDDIQPDDPKVLILDELIQKVTKLNDQVTKDEEIRQNQEATRQQNETVREENEQVRVFDELGRKKAEEERKTNELERITNENERKTNEEQRIANENNRVSNENARQEYINNLKTQVDNGDFNGADFNYKWDGTRLGVKNSKETTYQFVELKGQKGDKGEQGDVNLAQLNSEISSRENADINLQSQINGLASGSPLVASSTSEMLDTTRTYVNTTDGNWYYYNGTNWVSGGVYQSTGVDNDSIPESKTNFLNISPFGNLVDTNRFIENLRINHTSGVEIVDNDYKTSDFIEINKTDTFGMKNAFGFYNYYDADKNWLSGYLGDHNNFIELNNIPDNAKYIRFSVDKNNTNLLFVNKSYYLDIANYNLLDVFYVYNNFKLVSDNLLDKIISVNNLDDNLQDRLNTTSKPKLVLGSNFMENTKIKRGILTNSQFIYGSFNEDWYSTDYIEIQPNTDYVYYRFGFCCYYDEDKNWISQNANTTNNYQTYTSPSTAKYVVFSGSINNVDGDGVYKKDEYLNITSREYKYVPSLYTIDNLYITEDNLSRDVRDKLNSNGDTYYVDKIVNFIGDSITWGYDGKTVARAVYPYPTIVKDLLKLNNINNYGINGSTIGGDNVSDSDTKGTFPMNIRFSNMDDNADYIIVMGGTNDHGQSFPLGEITDTTNTSFYGALDVIINGLIEKYPTKRIAFMTPPRKQSMGANSKGFTFKEYVDAIKYKCEQYAIPYLDLYNICGGNPQKTIWRENNLPDGLHPSQDYYYILAKKIAEFIKGL